MLFICCLFFSKTIQELAPLSLINLFQVMCQGALPKVWYLRMSLKRQAMHFLLGHGHQDGKMLTKPWPALWMDHCTSILSIVEMLTVHLHLFFHHISILVNWASGKCFILFSWNIFCGVTRQTKPVRRVSSCFWNLLDSESIQDTSALIILLVMRGLS